ARPRPHRRRTDLHRGRDLPDGPAHDLRRPDPLPLGRGARRVEGEGPDLATREAPRGEGGLHRGTAGPCQGEGRQRRRGVPRRLYRHGEAVVDEPFRQCADRGESGTRASARAVRGLPRDLRGRRVMATTAPETTTATTTQL